MKIMGHRGAMGEYPENTLLGIKKAIQAGVGAIEVDIHLTCDKQLVVIHDDTLNRTTNGVGRVVDFTLEEIKKFDAGLGESVPTLGEVIELIKEANIVFFVEIKAADCERPLVEQLVKSQIQDLTIVKSFHHRIVKHIKEINSNITTACLLYGLPVDPVGMIKAANADGISISAHTVDKQLVDECHGQGLTVTAWNANRLEEVEYFKAMGVDYLGTDCPETILGV